MVYTYRVYTVYSLGRLSLEKNVLHRTMCNEYVYVRNSNGIQSVIVVVIIFLNLDETPKIIGSDSGFFRSQTHLRTVFSPIRFFIFRNTTITQSFQREVLHRWLSRVFTVVFFFEK